MPKILLVGSNQLFAKAIQDLELHSGTTLHAATGFDAIHSAVFNQPSKIVILEHTTEIHVLSLLKLLHSNVATTTIPVLLLSCSISAVEIIRQGVRADQTTVVTSWEDLIAQVNSPIKLDVTGELLVPALKLSQSYINHIEGFAGLRSMFEHSERHYFKKGARLFNPNELPKYFYYMYSGQSFTAVQLASGQRLVNGIFPTGTLFGTLSLIIGEPYSQFCEASQDCEVLAAPAEKFYEVVNSNIEFTKGMAAWMSRYTREVIYHASNVAYGKVKQRLANALLRLHYGTHRMEIHINRSDLGSIAGMSKESVVRTLSAFREIGILDVVVNRIHILDVPALIKIGRV